MHGQTDIKLTTRHQEAVTVYATYGIYHAENIKIM